MAELPCPFCSSQMKKAPGDYALVDLHETISVPVRIASQNPLIVKAARCEQCGHVALFDYRKLKS